jgi:hypothetical protein
LNLVLTVRFAAVRFLQALAVLLLAGADPAIADLYRWVDPETGSVKFSSYPPPWYGQGQPARRAPKVEVIAPMKSAPAFAPEAEADRAPAAKPGNRGEPRDELFKRLSQRIAAFVSSPPDGAAKAHAELLESLQDLEQMEKLAKFPNPGEQALFLEEKYGLALPLEAHRQALMQQLADLRPPPPGTAPEAAENLWRGSQLRMTALEWTNEVLRAIDPRKANARHFEMRAMAEKVATIWGPYVEAGFGRRDRVR